MEKSLASPAFLRRVFDEEERAFLLSLAPRKQPESAGANFAAKEAFLKACGTGIGGFALCEIQVRLTMHSPGRRRPGWKKTGSPPI